MVEGPRAARPDELAALVDLANMVFRRDGVPHDMARWFPLLFHRDNCRRLRVITEAGRPVSLAGFMIDRVHAEGFSFTVACIGSVVTAKECRGRGFATKIMDNCVALAREEGAEVLLISGGRGLYRRMGCIGAGEYHTVGIERSAAARASLPSAGCEVREWREEDLPHLAVLQKREPVRFERSPDQFRAFLGTGQLVNRACRTWVIELGGGIVAYLCCQDARDEPEGRVISVQEIGGSRQAILAAAPSLLERYDAKRVEMDCLGSDREMRALAAQLGLPVASHGFHGTVRVVDSGAAGSLLDERARCMLPGRDVAALRFMADPTGITVRRAGEEHRVEGLEDLTALLFASPERPAPLPARGPLRDLLARLLPIPLVDYGLNYV
jgi:GNAT superfamily N-acetyltransferase